jgi:hypothetical protein
MTHAPHSLLARLVLFVLCTVTVGLGPAFAGSDAEREEAGRRAVGAARIAQRYLRERRQPQRVDCSGLISEVYQAAGVERFNGSVAEMWAAARTDGLLLPRGGALEVGDLLFFDYTYIRGPGPADRTRSPLSHVAIVVSQDDDGAWTAVHYSATRRAPAPLRIDPLHPSDPARNDQLAMPGHPPLERLLLSGELLRGVARLGPQPSRSPVGPGLSTVVEVNGPTLTSTVRGLEPEADRASGRSPARTERQARRSGRHDRPSKPEDGPARMLRLQVQVVEDLLLDAAQLEGLGCEELWVLRNSAFAAHGYTFESERARRYFSAQPWYHQDSGVHEGNAWQLLGEVDRNNVTSIQRAEHEAGCR